jgi:hypothetical protein
VLGEVNYERKMYVDASKYLEKAIALGLDENIKRKAEKMYEMANVIAEIINNPVVFNPQVVKGISTKADEYLPILSPDQELVFNPSSSVKNQFLVWR